MPASAYCSTSARVAFFAGSLLTYIPTATAPQECSCATVGLVHAKSTTIAIQGPPGICPLPACGQHGTGPGQGTGRWYQAAPAISDGSAGGSFPQPCPRNAYRVDRTIPTPSRDGCLAGA